MGLLGAVGAFIIFLGALLLGGYIMGGSFSYFFVRGLIMIAIGFCFMIPGFFCRFNQKNKKEGV